MLRIIQQIHWKCTLAWTWREETVVCASLLFVLIFSKSCLMSSPHTSHHHRHWSSSCAHPVCPPTAAPAVALRVACVQAEFDRSNCSSDSVKLSTLAARQQLSWFCSFFQHFSWTQRLFAVLHTGSCRRVLLHFCVVIIFAFLPSRWLNLRILTTTADVLTEIRLSKMLC